MRNRNVSKDSRFEGTSILVQIFGWATLQANITCDIEYSNSNSMICSYCQIIILFGRSEEYRAAFLATSLSILDTHIGLCLIRWLMGDNTDFAASEFIHIFDKAVTYKVAISNKKNPFIIPEYFTIKGQ